MGNKGGKITGDSDSTAFKIVAQLEPIDGISSKKMFGGNGIFCNGKMFGIVDSKAQGFLKVDNTNKTEFKKYESFQHSRMPYFSIPHKIFEDKEVFIELAIKSIEISK